jgi:hypothetical protein
MKTVFATALLAVTVVASPAFARDASHSHHTAHRHGSSVQEGGTYLGSDPDPNVRFDLEREFNSRNGGY